MRGSGADFCGVCLKPTYGQDHPTCNAWSYRADDGWTVRVNSGYDEMRQAFDFETAWESVAHRVGVHESEYGVTCPLCRRHYQSSSDADAVCWQCATTKEEEA